MVEATKSYSRENSLYWQWIESKMRLGPLDEVGIDLVEAYEQFKPMCMRQPRSARATGARTSKHR